MLDEYVTMSPEVCVLITAWNQADKTMACLRTVFSQDYASCSVLLVDNGSEDDTVEQVSITYPDVEIVRTGRNLGFAAGYNIGMRRALARGFDYIFLLNNDTLLAPDCLSQLVQETNANPGVGLVTAKIYDAAEPKRIWTVGGRFHPWTLEVEQKGQGQIDRGQWDEARDIEFAPLCGVLLRRTMLEEIGLLDEQFFVYYEDMDFCLRAHEAGFRLRLAPRAHMWHVVAASSGGRDSPQERYWMAQSSGRYFRKHATGWRLGVIIPYRLGSAVKTSIRLLVRSRLRALVAYWWGLGIGWVTGRATTPPPEWIARR